MTCTRERIFEIDDECEDEGPTHIVPLGDYREHELSAACWCKPTSNEEYDDVLIHNSMDGREKHESGAPKH